MDPKKTTPPCLEADVLEAVDPSRREFLETLLKGAAFAAPVIASFSMGGLSLRTAEASPLCAANMRCGDFGPYAGPRKFVASFADTKAGNVPVFVVAVLRVAEDNSQISYRLHVFPPAEIHSFQIHVNEGDADPALTFEGSGNYGIVVNGPSSQGVITQADVFSDSFDPCTLDGVLGQMSTGCGRLILFLSDGSTLIGFIRPRDA